MRTPLFHLRGLLSLAGLAIALLRVEAQQKDRFPITPEPFDSKVKAVIFRKNPLDQNKNGISARAPSAIPASGVATIANGRVTGVRVTAEGDFRTEVRLEAVFSGGGGSGAAGSVEVGRRTMDYNGRLVVSWFVKGVQITNPGSGYTSPPTVTFVVKP